MEERGIDSLLLTQFAVENCNDSLVAKLRGAEEKPGLQD